MIYNSTPIQLHSKYISLDSRQIYDHAHTAFFAVKGIHHDGHQFIEILYQKGIREFIVEKDAWHGNLAEKAQKWNLTTIYVVKNSIECLQNIAALHRNSFQYPVIGITGSNGKTICKEWLNTMTRNNFNVVKSPKSFNSQIGVPLSVWGMNSKHNLAIFEAGISQMNEMALLEKIIKPNFGIFTHFGEAHGSNFKDDQQKLTEKLQLFKHSQVLIYRSTPKNDQINPTMKAINPSIKLITWSTDDPNKGIFVHFKKIPTGTQIKVQRSAASEPFLDLKTELNDEASLENLIHCILMANHIGIENQVLIHAVRSIKPISMRLEIKEGVRGNQIIDDSYNNDIDGLKLAIPLLNRNITKQKVLILSDFIETGIPENELYQEVATLLQTQKIDIIIGIGDQIKRNQEKFKSIILYSSTQDLINSAYLNQLHHATILLKGARKFNFEQIVYALEKKTHCTQLEINLDALQHNLTYFKEQIGPDVKLMVMLKAFAYGTGAVEIGQILQQQGIAYLTVAYTDEGVELRKNGIYAPIMVMNPHIEEFDRLTEYALEPQIYTIDMLHAIDEYSTSQGKNIKIHIKLDTGMKRLGFEEETISELTHLLVQMPQLWIVSILSHLAAAENPKHRNFTLKQIKTFHKMAKSIEKEIGYKPLFHIANSAGIQNYPNAKFDMVRLGISMYGITSNHTENKKLEPVLTLKTFVSQIKNIAKNETVGYGRKGKLTDDGRIATLAIGYADGYNRALGMGVGSFEINGQMCPTVGAICMDMTMVDISKIDDVHVGDTAIAFGGKIQLNEFAKNAKTIPYEIMTNISERVKRVYIKN